MKTYNEVAKNHQLEEPTKTRFITYMRLRWNEDEEIKCLVGYASEWAERFKMGIEYIASDSIGKQILQKIDNGATHDTK